MTEKTETKEDKKYVLVEVPTNYGIAIATPEGTALTNEQAMVEILNYLRDIKKAVG